ncbi:hypothetical protein [Haloarcula sp. CBA1127]|uniref:hypothetical protein n=1 Tax=Haloarcula sp. CBA1127 TaxID=1765055 RepID=UPI000AC9BE52|nr:hypothetical protein [Haloarcula sp. CBA1127]
MAVQETDEVMSEEGRALLTDREREIISGDADVSDNYRYKVESTVRNRVKKHLGEDLDFLQDHFPEVYEMVVDEVNDAQQD